MKVNCKQLLCGLLTFLTLGVTGCGCGDNGSTNPSDTPSDTKMLNCAVSRNRETNAISVTNNDTFSYKHFIVHLNESGFFDEGYMANEATIAPGQTHTYNLSSFVKTDGTRFQLSQTKIMDIEVQTKNDDGFITGHALLSSTD